MGLPQGRAGNKAWLAGLIFFVAAAGHGETIHEIAAWPMQGGAGVVTYDRLAYVAETEGGLSIIDLTESGAGAEAGHIELKGFCNDVVIDPKRRIAFIAAGFEGIHVVDVENPGEPKLLATIDTDGHADDLALDGFMLFNCDRENSFDIYDVRDVEAAHLAWTTRREGDRCRAVKLKNQIAYVVWDWSGLQVLDYSDPVHPREIGSVNVPEIAYDIDIFGSFAYVAAWFSGLHVVNIEDPAEPSLIASMPFPGNVRSVLAYNADCLFVLSETAGLFACDIRNPFVPRILAHIDTPGAAKAMAAGETGVVVADSTFLRVYRFGDAVLDPERAIVTGLVTEIRKPDAPVSGARVTIGDTTLITDNRGRFYLAGVPPGAEHWLHADAEGYAGKLIAPLKLKAGQNKVNVSLKPDRVELELVSITDALIVPAEGGSLYFTATIRNLRQTWIRLDGWTRVILPGGGEYPLRSASIMLAPDLPFVRTVSLHVPGSAPEGTYRYVATVGTWPKVVRDLDLITFVKLGSVPAVEGDIWRDEGWGEYTPESESGAADFPPGDLHLEATSSLFDSRAEVLVVLPKGAQVKVRLYNLRGHEVLTIANGRFKAGEHRFVVDATHLANGIYFFEVSLGDGRSGLLKVPLVQ